MVDDMGVWSTYSCSLSYMFTVHNYLYVLFLTYNGLLVGQLNFMTY